MNNNEQVFIDGSPCSRVVHTPGNEETELTCISPAITAIGAAAMSAAASGGENGTYGFFLSEEWASTIEVVNGRMPGLTHAVRYLSYQVRRAPGHVLKVCSHGNIHQVDIYRPSSQREKMLQRKNRKPLEPQPSNSCQSAQHLVIDPMPGYSAFVPSAVRL